MLDTLVIDSYESLLEYQALIHDLDIKMIKCEHAAIMNEDSTMLALAEEEYNSKLKEILKTIWNKIIEKIEEFIILMRKLINKFRTAFLLSKEFKTQLDNIVNHDGEIKNLNDIIFKTNKAKTYHHPIEGDAVHIKSLEKTNVAFQDSYEILSDPKAFDEKLRSSFDKVIFINKFDENMAKVVLENFSKFRKDSGNIKHSMLEKNDIINAYHVLVKFGPEWIKLFENARRKAKEQSRMVFSPNPDRHAALQASIFQRMINKGIMYIQSVMTACFKICYAIKRINLPNSNINISEEKKKILIEIEKLERKPNKQKAIKLLNWIEKLKKLFDNRKLNEGFSDELTLENLAERVIKTMLIKQVHINKLLQILDNDNNFELDLKVIERLYKNKKLKDPISRKFCYYTALISSMVLFKNGIKHKISFGSSIDIKKIAASNTIYIIHGWVKDSDGNIYESNMNEYALGELIGDRYIRLPAISVTIDDFTLSKDEYKNLIRKELIEKVQELI